MTNNKNAKPRYEGANWDKPVVKVTTRGIKNIERKVLTLGVRQLDATELIDKIRELMRQGYEVRLNCRGESALRFVPLADRECRKIEPRAFFMGDMAKILDDKKLVVNLRGRDVPQSKVQGMVDRARTAVRKIEESTLYATPDMMVTCPNCGTTFRVGRPERD